MPTPQYVVIRNNEFLMDSGKIREVTQVEIFICGMWLSKDLLNDRDERLAAKLAELSGVDLQDYRIK